LKACKHPDLAYELVSSLAGKAGQENLAASGLSMPALRSVAASKFFLDGKDPKSKGFLVDAVKDGHFQSFDPNFAEWILIVGSYLDRVFTGDDTPEKALAKAAKEVNAKFFKKP